MYLGQELSSQFAGTKHFPFSINTNIDVTITNAFLLEMIIKFRLVVRLQSSHNDFANTMICTQPLCKNHATEDQREIFP